MAHCWLDNRRSEGSMECLSLKVHEQPGRLLVPWVTDEVTPWSQAAESISGIDAHSMSGEESMPSPAASLTLFLRHRNSNRRVGPWKARNF